MGATRPRRAHDGPHLPRTLVPAGRPVVVQVWAPWCNSCRTMEPMLERLAGDYAGQVDLRRVQADAGTSHVRHTGAVGERDLRYLFDQAVAAGRAEGAPRESVDPGAVVRPAAGLRAKRVDRSLRVAAGAALVAAGLLTGPAPVLVGIGVVVGGSAWWPRGTGSR
ncbi:MAG: thioredoxin family protein [Acidimicrobiales bacterium]|nr:thioredoxin family protein [Acidimicrobiales bacterium]